MQKFTTKTDQRYRSRGHFSRAWGRLLRKKIAVGCMIVISLLYLGGILANWISPYQYFEQDYTVIRQPPSFVLDKGIQSFWTESHFLGTDRTGRDLFTRILWGIQNTLILTVIGMVTGGLVIGVTMGLIAGYFEKSIDALIMRTGEIFALIPTFFLVLIIAATLRPRILMWIRWVEDNTFFEGLVRSGVTDYIVISLSLVIFSWFGTARLIRGQILYLKGAQYIDAATAIGASTKRILFKHLLPNSMSTLIVTVTMGMGTMVGVEIFLSWIGLGIQPPRPSLGVLLWEGGNISVLRSEPWMLLAPAGAATLMMLAWNLLGDALNDVLNPRTR